MPDNRNNNRRSSNSRNKESIEDVLPSSQILEKFEDAVPGSVDNLIEMAEKEQEHRHEWQERYLSSYNLTFRFGQLVGLIYNLGLLCIIYKLINSGDKELALQLFAINAAIMAFAILATTIERKIFSRRPAKYGNRSSSKRRPQHRNQSNRSRDSREQNRR